MDGEALRETVASNRQLEEQLTKRNEQYIFDLKKALKVANLTEEEITLVLADTLPQLVAGQKSGKTARILFGTVTQYVQVILNKPKEVKASKAWQVWLDNSLLFFAMLAILNGGMSLFTKGKGQGVGITALFATSAIGGLIFYYMYKWIYQYDRPGADKIKRPKMWKSMLLLSLGMLLWIVVYTGSMLLPFYLNPVFDSFVTILLGLIAISIRMWFKKKYQVVGSFFTR